MNMMNSLGRASLLTLVLSTAAGCGPSVSDAAWSREPSPSGAGLGGAAPNGNPFVGAKMYVNPDYARQVQHSMDLAPVDAARLQKMKAMPTAVWLDRIATVEKVGPILDAALAQQKREGKPVVTVFVVYNLPDRDCHANASRGELFTTSGGLATYKADFIDPIAAAFEAHPNQRIVVILEPDSLPNIATNLSDPRCAAAEGAYRDGTAYAIAQLAAPNVSLYLDTGHSGWLGWPNNQQKMAGIFKEVLDAAGGSQQIRGFASNVSNYTVLRETKERFDYQSNPVHDELTYAAQLSAVYKAAGLANVAWLIDTGRNGVGGIRHQWGYWCNNRGAGLGERPAAAPAPGIDAYYWVKPPGESDGTSDPTAPLYDLDCGKEDAAKPAPDAGQWFHSYFVDVVKNANPPL